jgi:hypothetical protein
MLSAFPVARDRRLSPAWHRGSFPRAAVLHFDAGEVLINNAAFVDARNSGRASS